MTTDDPARPLRPYQIAHSPWPRLRERLEHIRFDPARRAERLAIWGRLGRDCVDGPHKEVDAPQEEGR